MSVFVHGLSSVSGVSPHRVLVGLGLETDDHAAGVLCGSASLSSENLTLDDTVVFETGQAPGQLSAARANRLANGVLGTGTDFQIVISYLGLTPGTATSAQTQAALQAFMRVVRKLV